MSTVLVKCLTRFTAFKARRGGVMSYVLALLNYIQGLP